MALVTGASRGIGASVAVKLAERGAAVIVNFRSKAARADDVVSSIRQAGGEAVAVQADLTQAGDIAAMAAFIRARHGGLDVLVLNASGGLERDKPPSYAHEINHTAQVRLLDACLPLLRTPSRVIFVTSHMAHFYGERESVPEYEPVAASKHAGEMALRQRLAGLPAGFATLVVASGDIIEGTITPRLLDRMHPGLIEARRSQSGSLPSVEDFAEAIVAAAAEPRPVPGSTIYVGSVPDATG